MFVSRPEGSGAVRLCSDLGLAVDLRGRYHHGDGDVLMRLTLDQKFWLAVAVFALFLTALLLVSEKWLQ